MVELKTLIAAQSQYQAARGLPLLGRPPDDLSVELAPARSAATATDGHQLHRSIIGPPSCSPMSKMGIGKLWGKPPGRFPLGDDCHRHENLIEIHQAIGASPTVVRLCRCSWSLSSCKDKTHLLWLLSQGGPCMAIQVNPREASSKDMFLPRSVCDVWVKVLFAWHPNIQNKNRTVSCHGNIQPPNQL